MKCKHCGHATIYKVRLTNGGQCEKCGHKFAFEPKTDPNTIGDPLFDRAVQNVSSVDTVFFSPRQLWYEVERRLRRRRLNSAGWIFFVFAFFGVLFAGFMAFVASYIIFFFIGLLIAALLVVAGVAARFIEKRREPHPAMTYSTFQSSYYRTWVRTHGEFEKLAPSNGQPRTTPPLTHLSTADPSELPPTNLNTANPVELMKLPISRRTAWSIVNHRSKGKVFEKLEDLLEVPGIGRSTLESLRSRVEFRSESTEQNMEPSQSPSGEPDHRSHIEPESDLTGYSFDRALVTDHAEIAAMLVANNFHFENNCAVLSVDGYPEGNADTVMTMLRRNPELQVYALHDASTAGCSLPLTLREERWFPDPAISVVDLGLRPRHAMAMRLFTLAGTSQIVPESLKRVLAPEEVVWLESGHVAEVSVLRPSRLIRGIYQGFSRGRDLDSEAARDSEREEAYASSGWFYYGDFYGSDSFG